jgi:hypothetical protein
MSNIDDESAGSFRRSDLVGISGCDRRLTPAFEVEDELTNIIENSEKPNSIVTYKYYY